MYTYKVDGLVMFSNFVIYLMDDTRKDLPP